MNEVPMKIRYHDEAHVRAREYMRKWNAAHPRTDAQRARATEQQRGYYKAHVKTREEMDAHNRRNRKYKMANREKIRSAYQIYYANNREQVLARELARRAANREKHLLALSRIRARKLGLPHAITENDLIIPPTCPLLGIPIDYRDKRHCASVDRIDNAKGYVPGNVRVISFRANSLKGNATIDELKAISVNLAGYIKAVP